MPSKPHRCAHPDCSNMVARSKAQYCRSHAIKTPEHNAKVSAALKGRVITPEHRSKISASLRGNGNISRKCEQCNKAFNVAKPSQPNRFCSRDCGYKSRAGINAINWNPDMPITTCRTCGKQFRNPSSVVSRFCCSYVCKNIWQLSNQKTSGTNIELIVEAALASRGWNYQSQCPLCSVTVADFYISDFNVAVFCDGDYWHGLPGRKERDASQTKVLQNNGITVYRFLGSSILADVNACLDKIKHH